ncbi:hypothetical protein [Thiobacillus sedimenti]|uniref:Uncharacterized protein n=1 Tax=Thiobacillus sedimenti TaxID=3110231 RepID=A0ABZ1CMG0_9PROT|nr:hypothetical protein [Thiobacillus sp. SCUT-2]WRS40461.1 hypothetical protein VA613_06185 [Thiobacillus sp. SCUT-2]
MADKPITHLPLVTDVVAIMHGDLRVTHPSSSENLEVLLDTQGETHLLFSLTPQAASALKATLETLLLTQGSPLGQEPPLPTKHH